MKHELDEQLKTQWEAANIEDFDLEIDTDALWNRIEKPKTKKKHFMVSAFKYAAAVAVGMVLSWTILNQNTEKIITIKDENPKPQKAIVTKDEPSALTGIVQKSDKAPAVPVKKKQMLPAEMVQKSEVKKVKSLELFPEKENITSEYAQTTNEVKGEIVLVANPKKTLKTIHISDLEQPVSKVQQFNNFFVKRTEQAADDVAISTKIINKQF